MSTLQKKFTEEDIINLMDFGCVYVDEYDDENIAFEVVHKEVIDSDLEKNSVTYMYVIQEHSTGKYYWTQLSFRSISI